MFGVDDDNFITFLFLLLKYYIYTCKFQERKSSFVSYKAYVNSIKELEYSIAKKNNRLPVHFKKWRFTL